VIPILELDEIIPDLKAIDLNTLNVTTTLVLATYEVLVETNPSETNPSDHSMKLYTKMRSMMLLLRELETTLLSLENL
jgi:hypothetical protein